MGRRDKPAAVADKARTSALTAVASRFSKFRPAIEVLTAVRAVPTCFIQLDHATRVGGFPIERFSLGHGPSNEGKTALALGLCASFLALDHFAFYVDAERTTPWAWVEDMLRELAKHPGFYACRPESYEKTIQEVRDFLNLIRVLRGEGKIPLTTSALIVADSLRKLVPKDQLDEVLKAAKEDRETEKKAARGRGKKSALPTAGRDRSAQLKAKMNAAWMDELVPLLEHAQAGFFAIAREMMDPEADPNARKWGGGYKVGGGSAIYYDASLVLRVERAGWVTKGESEDDRKIIYGERHRVTIRKTKIGGKEGRVTTCFFHTSNGTFIPAGFDRARDVLELAERFDIVKRKSAWLTWDSRRWNGTNAAVQKLTSDPKVLAVLEREVRAQFVTQPPAEHTADGEVLAP